MDLPLIIDATDKRHLAVFKPQEGQPLVAGHHLIATSEDLEALPVELLAQIYNQVKPGLNVTSFKPGTVIKYCLPALFKLAEVQAVPVIATPVAEAAGSTPTSPEEAPSMGSEAAKEKPVKTAKKRDVVDKYKKGDKELKAREGSLRHNAFTSALADPAKLNAKEKSIVSWLLREGHLVRVE